jgi:hypothetical protein
VTAGDPADARTLIAVGFWHVDGEKDEFPLAQSLVGEPYAPDLCEGICRYLESGATFMSWRGFSSCRFRCGIYDGEMGSSELSDGRWVWPEGLPHYVRAHHIRLPEEFLQTMRAANWTIPRPVDLPAPRDMPDGSLLIPITGRFWIEWARSAALPVQR